MLKLGRAQGVAMAAGLSREVAITEYSPKKIKMAITGNGNASKEQVAKMLQKLFKIETLPKNLDATDGLAAAVCHYYNRGKFKSEKSYSGWSAFVNKNPEPFIRTMWKFYGQRPVERIVCVRREKLKEILAQQNSVDS